MLNKIEQRILKEIQLPDNCYELAQKHYEALASFLRKDSKIVDLDPQIQPQGSFRTGTAIYPQDRKKEYDLDLTLICKKVLPQWFSQKEFKQILLGEISQYAKLHQMKKLEDKRRCFTLHYREQNGICFHEDIVPAIPKPTSVSDHFPSSDYPWRTRNVRQQAICEIYITDRERPDFEKKVNEWQPSNPEGLAQWLESKKPRVEEMQGVAIVPLPPWKRKTELKEAIQLMKWHRDCMFKNNSKCKPASIILSVLAAEAYKPNVASMSELIANMYSILEKDNFRVYNPLDKREQFTDKWREPKHRSENLEGNFINWLNQAKMDFEILDYRNLTREDAKDFLSKNFNLPEIELPFLDSSHVNNSRIKVEKPVIKKWRNY